MMEQVVVFFREHWYLLAVFAAMSAVAFLLLRLQVMLRDQTARTIESLIRTDPRLCLERLENNRRLKWLYRKSVLLLWKLDCYLALGEDGKVRLTVDQLRSMKLEPRDRVELYQREISFFATNDPQRAVKSRDELKAFLKEAGAEKEKHYAALMEEADLIIGIYVDRNTGLIRKLIGRAEHTKNDILRGVTQYRVAKLAYFKGDTQLMQTYLIRAGKNLKGTWYEPVIRQAMEDPGILDIK